ncbi:unnamed protein product [Camellia sinensis]
MVATEDVQINRGGRPMTMEVESPRRTEKERRGLITEFFNSEERKMKLQRSQGMCKGPAGGQGEAAARR